MKFKSIPSRKQCLYKRQQLNLVRKWKFNLIRCENTSAQWRADTGYKLNIILMKISSLGFTFQQFLI